MTGVHVPLQRRCMSPAEFGQVTGLPEKTVTHLIRKGEIYARKAGRRWVIPNEVLDEFLAVPDQGASP